MAYRLLTIVSAIATATCNSSSGEALASAARRPAVEPGRGSGSHCMAFLTVIYLDRSKFDYMGAPRNALSKALSSTFSTIPSSYSSSIASKSANQEKFFYWCPRHCTSEPDEPCYAHNGLTGRELCSRW
eukprot:4409686-Pleurochrysis_carterae.AAC.1